MKNISIKEVRNAIAYVCQNDGLGLQNISDEKLVKLDFVKDLNIGNVRLVNIAIELQRVYNFSLPWGVFRTRKDDTVGTFLSTINKHLSN
ncbi:MAG: hypothetical protein J6N45_08450 [Alphaproteobacteria bacterium]|nr:hypothetical protein [Alphaproteobacteria bacterium]